MTAVTHTRRVTRALTLLLAASLLATCGDDTSSSKDDRGVFGDMADALMQAEADFLTANAAIFASADAMKPYINETLELHNGALRVSATTSCLVDGSGGIEWRFNGASYVFVEPPYFPEDIPEFIARFRLYRLAGGNHPQLNQMIGYLDVSCLDSGDRIAGVQIYNANLELVHSITYSPTSSAFNGIFRTPGIEDSLMIHGNESSVGAIRFFYALSTEMEASFNYPVPWGDETLAIGTVRVLPPENWGFVVEVAVDTSGEVVYGHVYFAHPINDPQLTACITRGTLAEPVLSAPTQECDPNVPLYSTSSVQRQDMFNTYVGLREFWLKTFSGAEICRALIPPENK